MIQLSDDHRHAVSGQLLAVRDAAHEASDAVRTNKFLPSIIRTLIDKIIETVQKIEQTIDDYAAKGTQSPQG